MTANLVENINFDTEVTAQVRTKKFRINFCPFNRIAITVREQSEINLNFKPKHRTFSSEPVLIQPKHR